MDAGYLIILLSSVFASTNAVRLHKLFQYIDGYKAMYNLRGFLHVGTEYAVFLKTPRPHDKYLIYELYESRNLPEKGRYSPRLLAISKIPVQYIRDQLKTYRSEVYNAKYTDKNVVPGTQVKTVREWQIERALDKAQNGKSLKSELPILRTIL